MGMENKWNLLVDISNKYREYGEQTKRSGIVGSLMRSIQNLKELSGAFLRPIQSPMVQVHVAWNFSTDDYTVWKNLCESATHMPHLKHGIHFQDPKTFSVEIHHMCLW